MSSFDFWQFIAGVALFVYAMTLIETALKNLAGRSFKKFLQKQSQYPLKTIAATAVITGFLQSSSIVLLTVLSFVGAGLMNIRGALAAVLGSNLGTTLYSWVIALLGFKIDLHDFAFPLLGIALIGLLFAGKKNKLSYFTTFLIGFALVFISLEWLKGSVDNSLESYLGNFSNLHYLLFIPIGFIVTAIIQSSSATIAITLSLLYNGLIPFESAAAIVIGSELGTTLKFLLGSAGGIIDKRRVAWGNFLMNTITMLIAIIMLNPFIYVIQNIIGIKDDLVALVAFQTSINFFSILFFYPFLNPMARLLERFITEKENHSITRFIGKTPAVLPGDALEAAEKETLRLLEKTIRFNTNVFDIDEGQKGGWKNNFINMGTTFSLEKEYNDVKRLQGKILEYISDIPEDQESEKEIKETAKLITITRHAMRSAKNMKDIYHNLREFEASVNDYLFSIYKQMQEQTAAFYNEMVLLLQHPQTITSDRIIELTEENRKRYDGAIAVILLALKEDKINELDSSSFINVYRESYSSNKALISALADFRGFDVD